jgi:hypothetical protein
MLVSRNSNRLDSTLEMPKEMEAPPSVLIEDRLVQDREAASGPTNSQSMPDNPANPAASDPLPPGLQTGNSGVATIDDVEADANGAEASFLQYKRPNSFWRKSVVRATLVLLGLLLLFGLSGQIIFHERDQLLALQPTFRPWLLAFCQPLNCTLSPLRQIEFVTIDSSSFTKIGAQAYRLNMTLKNTAAVPLALPAIEVTLTNSSDQPVVRRVLLPNELDAKSNPLEAGLERPASLILAVKKQSPADQITGYRLLAFYP